MEELNYRSQEMRSDRFNGGDVASDNIGNSCDSAQQSDESTLPGTVRYCGSKIVVEIGEEIYSSLADSLLEAVGDGYYYSGSIDYDREEFYSTLTATVIVYREDRTVPEGGTKEITDIVPVWWEFTTVIPKMGEVLNDFSFRSLRDEVMTRKER